MLKSLSGMGSSRKSECWRKIEYQRQSLKPASHSIVTPIEQLEHGGSGAEPLSSFACQQIHRYCDYRYVDHSGLDLRGETENPTWQFLRHRRAQGLDSD